MKATDNYTDVKEDQPRNINLEELNVNPPAQDLQAKDKTPLKESELGREQGQTPADEQFDAPLSQIDKGTVKMQEEKSADKETGSEDDDESEEAEGRDSSGYANDINDTDDRDESGDSTEDWDAQHNRSGRNR